LIKIFNFYKKKNLSTDMCSTHVEALEWKALPDLSCVWLYLARAIIPVKPFPFSLATSYYKTQTDQAFDDMERILTHYILSIYTQGNAAET
jgi:hypothetical protein